MLFRPVPPPLVVVVVPAVDQRLAHASGIRENLISNHTLSFLDELQLLHPLTDQEPPR